jgi:hypothetical protein
LGNGMIVCRGFIDANQVNFAIPVHIDELALNLFRPGNPWRHAGDAQTQGGYRE